MRRSYAVVFERGTNNYGAYCPDVPGCVSVGEDWPEMLAMIREALSFHIESMLEDGEAFPAATMSVSDAMRYHCDLIDEDGYELLEEAKPEPSTEVTVAMVEVEINVPTSAAASVAAVSS